MNKPAPLWRLILSRPLPGAENMAIDEALLRSFDPVKSQPLLRLYSWNPPTLSLGRFQNAADVLDLERTAASDVPIVRRITGGGVIYHTEELTYSLVCAPEQIPPANSVKDSFRVLTGFLMEFYRRLGLPPGYAADSPLPTERLGGRTPFCFAGRESFDILINGCKIGGNAQRRTKGMIFQHGSIPLNNRSETGLMYMRDRRTAQIDAVTSLSDCGVRTSVDELAQLLQHSFRDHFGVTLQTSELTEIESVEMKQLLTEKYRQEVWNMNGGEL
ncbi:MAG: biotin/lipoate A/B protein ligase family protein [Desulfuromonadaceae bacterium]|nr:biotin/lipoate A/B protein ligase family protein [Desulfuromonadaceae bacterium]MDD2856375.1 biotin/lipoate A/B protein ligase family protein [Desulfuromonadaceae bacterium]